MKANPFRSVLALMACGMAATAHAQVVLNEVMADNRGVVENGADYPDYVELHNPTAQAVSLAGMSLTDDPVQPQRFVFPAGTVVAAGGYLVVWCDSNAGSPGLHTGFGLGAKGDRVRLCGAQGAVLDEIVFGLQVANLSLGRVPNGSGAWALTRPTPRGANAAQALAPAASLRLNEWMARPLTGDDWLEVYNGEGLPVALGGLVITDRASGAPTNRAIPSLSFIAARGFLAFYASDLDQPDADHLDFKLGSSGETLTIYATNRETIIDRVTFGEQTQNVSQGRVPDGSDQVVFLPAGRATPGEPNFSEVASVVISEVLSHTDPPLEDAIELHNPTAAPVDISHWWLSDAASQPRKYRVPPGTVIAAGGYRVFYQYQLEAGPIGFTLDSSEGDEVFLSVGDADGNLTGRQTWVAFGGLKNGISAGRHATSAGVDFVPLTQRTFGVDSPGSLTQFRQGAGLPNAAPRVGPVIINEIMFRPPELGGLSNTEDEFIELRNPTTAAVRLYDPAYPTNRWRLRDGVAFDWPADCSIPAGGYLLLVSFDPLTEPAQLAAFRGKYAVPAGVPVLGPYEGKLSDAGEALELLLPDEPQGPDKPNPGYVPYMQVERIRYAGASPWPTGAAGTGLSLQRRVALDYGNEPRNWVAAAPTPGRANTSDSDNDGMPDAWESAHDLNPYSAADATQDPDGDLAGNLAEFLAGTHPQDRQSVFRILQARPGNGSLHLTVSAVAGRTYTVQCRDQCASGPWQNLTNLTAATGELNVVVPATGWPSRFYRLMTPAHP